MRAVSSEVSAAAQGLDALGHGADLTDPQAKLLADFDSLTETDGLVVDLQFERGIERLFELDDRAATQIQNLRQRHVALGQLDDHGNFEPENAFRSHFRGLR